MSIYFWLEFSILLIAAILGSCAIIPYSLRLLKESPKGKKLKMPLWMLFILSVLQNSIVFAIVVFLGLLVSTQIGHGAPLVASIVTHNGFETSYLFTTLLLGIAGGVVLLVLDILFLPYFPKKLLDTALKTTYLENVTASFYGGINEELFMRFFGLSAVVWLISGFWHTPAGLHTTAIFWIANSIMALIFAFGHLPALKPIVGEITPFILSRTLILNIPIGLLCGWIFWNYGIEAAMLAHFSADIVYHVGGTGFLRWNYRVI